MGAPMILIENMKRINKSQDGKISDVNGNSFTLSSGHYNTPKIIVNEMDNAIRQEHKSDNSGGGKMSMTEKHNWDLIKLEMAPCIVASRDRNKDNPSDRTPGNKVEQRLEPRTDGQSNTLTSVEKDNYLLDRQLKIRRLTEIECERL
jgi:hypothetical protein